jgi:hypothetical protein
VGGYQLSAVSRQPAKQARTKVGSLRGQNLENAEKTNFGTALKVVFFGF